MYKLVKKAIKCGVDAIKLQTFKPNLYYSKDEKRISRLNRFRLSQEDFIKVKEFVILRIYFFSLHHLILKVLFF